MAYQMVHTPVTLNDLDGHFISFKGFEMQVVYICAALYKISTVTPASRGPSATAGLLVHNALDRQTDSYRENVTTIL